MKQIIYIFLIIVTTHMSCGKPKIILLCKKHYPNELHEIYLVENRPRNPEKLRELMIAFNEDLKKSNQSVERTFLKPHENGILDIIFNDQINYSKNGCKELDNMDFIYRVTKYNNYGGNDTIVYYMFNE